MVEPPPAFGQIVERIGQVPGVVHASMILGGTPISFNMSTTPVTVPGGKEGGERASIRRVTPDYHKALRIPLKRGRMFETSDRLGGLDVAIVNESAAKQFFPGQDPIGRTVKLRRRRLSDTTGKRQKMNARS